MNKEFKQSLLIFITKVAMVAFGLLAVAFLAQHFSASHLGEYFWILSVAGFLSVVIRFGRDNALVRQLAVANSHHRQVLLSNAITWVCIASTFYAIAVLFVFSLELFSKNILWQLLLLPPILCLISLFGFAFQVQNKAHWQLFYAQLPRLLIVPLVLVGLFHSLLYGLVLSAVLALLVIVIHYYAKPGNYFVIPKLNQIQWRGYTSYLQISLLAVIMAEGATILLGLLSTKFETAIFAIAVRLTALLGFVLISLNSVLMPAFAKQAKSKQNMNMLKSFQTARNAGFTVSIALALILAFLSPYLLPLFGEKFSASYPVILILLIAQVMKSLCGSTGQLLMMTGRKNLQRRSLFISASILLVVLSASAQSFGAMGAALATLIAVSVNNLLGLYYCKRHFNVPLLPFINPSKK